MLANRSLLGTVLILGAAGLLVGRATVAEARSDAARGTIRSVTMQTQSAAPVADRAVLRRATKLMGEPIKNTQGVTLGKIDDIVLTPELNNVSYAVVTRGGLFGFGKHRYAIPWSIVRAGVGSTIVVPINKQDLKYDPGFRSHAWPAEGDPRWLGPAAGQPAERITFTAQPSTSQKDIRNRRVSHIIGMRVRDPQGDKVGKVKDMVVAVNTGEVPYTVIGYRGLLSLRDRYAAVPAGAIEIWPGQSVARVRVNKETLMANSFDPRQFPDLSNPAYSERLFAAYNVRPEEPDWTVLGYIPPEPRPGTQATTPYQPQTTTPIQPQGMAQTQAPITFPAQPQTTAPIRPQAAFPAQQQGAIQNQPQATMPAQPQGVVPGLTQSGQQTSQLPQIAGQQAPQANDNAVRSEYLAAFTPDKLRTIEGVVTGVSSFQLVGTNAEWIQLQVRTDDGELVTVHLGPRDFVSHQSFYVAANDRIKLTGGQATAWRQPIILPITATVGNETITLRDQTGHPLWDKFLPQNQPPTQDQQQPAQGQQQSQGQTPTGQPQTQPGQTQPAQPRSQPQGAAQPQNPQP
jgi:sporulation protein YlmC with PRC-barrel domain